MTTYTIIPHPRKRGWTFRNSDVRYPNWTRRKPYKTALDVMVFLRSRSVPWTSIVWPLRWL